MTIYYFNKSISQNSSKNILQLNGTAVPSLALENLQDLENQNLSESDHNMVEEVITGTLGSMYAG